MRGRNPLAVCALGLAATGAGPGEATLPPILVSRETTYITSPLTADGLPDYGSWLDARGDAGIPLSDNAAPPLLAVFGLEIDAGTRRRLGLPAEDPIGPRFVRAPVAGDRSWAEARARRGVLEPAADGLVSLFVADTRHAGDRRVWAEEETPVLGEWIADNDEALDAIAEAASRPGYWWPRRGPGLATGAFPSLLGMRQAGDALAWRAALRAASGRGPQAVDDLVADLRLSALTARGGSLLEGLLGSAVRERAADTIAALAPLLHPRDAERLLEGIEALPEFPSAERFLEAERVVQLGTFLELRRRGAARGARAWKDWIEAGGLREAPAGIYDVDPAAVDWNELLRRVNRAFDGGEAAGASPETDLLEEAIGIYSVGRVREGFQRTQESLDRARDALRRTAGIDALPPPGAGAER